MPEYLYLLPIAVVIAAIYSSSGISGANFWVPVYLLLVRIDPVVGFWLALVTMLFGSLGGLIGHTAQGTVDYRRAAGLLVASLPAALAGARLAPAIPSRALMLGFGLFALGCGVLQLARWPGPREGSGRRAGDLAAAAVGGALVGLISVGLGALLAPRGLGERRPVRAAGTVLAAVFVTSLVAALAQLRPEFRDTLATRGDTIRQILLIVVPGVLLGGLTGSRIARRLEQPMMRRYVASLLVIVGALMLIRALSGA